MLRSLAVCSERRGEEGIGALDGPIAADEHPDGRAPSTLTHALRSDSRDESLLTGARLGRFCPRV